MGKEKGGVPLTDYVILSEKRVKYEILYLKNYEKEEEHLKVLN